MDMNRRSFLGTMAGTAAAVACGRAFGGIEHDVRTGPLPTSAQQKWQDCEVVAVFHYDTTTFRPGHENHTRRKVIDPQKWNPTRLNTDQWIEAARDMGAKLAILTATHESGFLQWQTDLYPYGVRQSPWRDGKGDLVKEFVESCRRYDIIPGLYIGLRFNAYNGVYQYKLTEKSRFDDIGQYMNLCEKIVEQLCSRYGDLLEIWFDGGVPAPWQGGPELMPIVDRHQPELVFYHSNQRRDHRWIGNEKGVAGYPCWATISDVTDNSGQGTPGAPYWSPPMCDAPLRDHSWFWHPDEEHKIESLDSLLNMYYKSVGRNGNLILGITPDTRGLVPEADVKRMREFGKEIRRRFGEPLARTSGQGTTVELELPRGRKVDHVSIMEHIRSGERVRKYTVEGRVSGGWEELCSGKSVGHRRIQRFEPRDVKRIRLRVSKAADSPKIRDLAAYSVG